MQTSPQQLRWPLRRPNSPPPQPPPFKCANPACIATRDRLLAITMAYAKAPNRHRTTTETISMFRPRFPLTRTTIVQRPPSTPSTSPTLSPSQSSPATTPSPPPVSPDNLHLHADSQTRPDPTTTPQGLAEGHLPSAKATPAKKNAKTNKFLSAFITIITHLFI